jgi:hypothetical protein
MPLENPNVIDFLAFDAETDDVVLGITEIRPWDGSDERVQEIEEKVNAYLYFALDGAMTTQLPQLEGKSVRLQLDCVQEPDDRMAAVILAIQQMTQNHSVRFTYRVVPELAEILAAQAQAMAQQKANGGCCGRHHHAEGEPTPDGCCGGHGHGEEHSHGGCGNHGEDEGCCGKHEHGNEEGCCGKHDHSEGQSKQDGCCGGHGH